MINMLPCLDSDDMAVACQKDLDLSRCVAAELGRSAVTAADRGYYIYGEDTKVEWGRLVKEACTAKVSIPPDAHLQERAETCFPETRVQVINETTLGASRRFVEGRSNTLALNFANGVQPGGGFLNGARAQEEVLCRSSALFHTLKGDEMYLYHHRRPRPDSSAWAIYSPAVPVFRADCGTELENPWLLNFVTCAAPYAPSIGQPESRELLQKRIHRVLAIARAYGYSNLVLGAWGCGAFRNDPHRTAADFREALENDFQGAFADVVFAIADWSPERRYLGPFRDVFAVSGQKQLEIVRFYQESE